MARKYGEQFLGKGYRAPDRRSELTTMYFRCLLIFCLLAGSPLLAQEKAVGVSRNEEAMSSFQTVNASIDTILQEYEQLTGNALIMDSSLAANALPISISVPKPVPRSELVRIIESVLLQSLFGD